jgi:hypothetical protein
MLFAMAGMAGIDTFVNVVAFRSNVCDPDEKNFGKFLMQKRYLYPSTGVFLRQR